MIARRALLAALPIAAASPALANLHLAHAEPSAELVRLIAAHFEAYDTLVEACTLSDELDPRYDPSFTGWDNADAAESAARKAVLAAPCHSLADVQAKAAHLVRRIEAGDQDFTDRQDIEALLRSINIED